MASPELREALLREKIRKQKRENDEAEGLLIEVDVVREGMRRAGEALHAAFDEVLKHAENQTAEALRAGLHEASAALLHIASAAAENVKGAEATKGPEERGEIEFPDV